MSDLQSVILELIKLRKEGDYWDFKGIHCPSKADLLHDIICLANNLRHKGDRYLIFGVNDKGDILGIQNDTKRRKQHDIINILQNSSFAGGVYPEVRLETIKLDTKEIDVLIIKDTKDKPYYLEKEYKDKVETKEKVLHAGTIYSRTLSNNTPKNGVASIADIENMWRQRFGLDVNPLERLENYLPKYEEWEEMEESYWYHKQFPEFTIKRIGERIKDSEGKSWERAALDPRSYEYEMGFFYHQTLLKEMSFISYDGGNAETVKPETLWVELYGEQHNYNCFYAYIADSFDFLCLQFIKKSSANKLLTENVPNKDRMRPMPVLIFKDIEQKDCFLSYLKDNPQVVEEDDSEILIFNNKLNEEQILHLKYCTRVCSVFNKWRPHPNGGV
jgi:hypothetical protein